MPSDETPLGGRSPEGKDVTVCQDEPRKNTIFHSHLNTTVRSGASRATCALVLEFDILGETPRNTTVRQAMLMLWVDPEYYGADAQKKATFARNLALRNVMTPWDEDTATWGNFPESNVNGTVAPAAWYNASDGNNAFGTAFGQTFSNTANAPFPIFFFPAQSAEGAMRGYGTQSNGWLVRDEANGVCSSAVDCTWSFFSSGVRNTENRPRQDCNSGGFGRFVGTWQNYRMPDYCWPSLQLQLEVHRAVPSHMKFSVNATKKPAVYDASRTVSDPYHVSGTKAWNLSVDVADQIGRIRRVTVEVRNETGVPFLREDLASRAYNRTFDVRKSPGDRSIFWSNQAWDLPDGRYYFNVTTEDSDGNLAYLNMTRGRPVVFVENVPPGMRLVRFPTELPQGAVANFTLNLTDPRGVDAVHAFVTTPSGAVETLRLKPTSYDWGVERSWFEPGVHKVRFRANDTLGNVNETTHEFRVLDVRLPTPCASMPRPEVTTPVRRGDAGVQEEGGPVAVVACATDETPLRLEVEVRDGDGQVVRHPMHERAPGVHNGTFPASGAGRQTLRVLAHDADGNVADLGAFALEVEPARAPRIHGLAPAAGTWANGTTWIGATLTDVNLDRTSVRVELQGADGGFERVTPLVRAIGADAFVTFAGRAFEHGQVVTARIAANDTLGHVAPPVSWSFRVDSKPPRLDAVLVGDVAPGSVASFVTRGARLNATPVDDGAGVERVEAQWRNVDLRLETPWLPLDGRDARVVDPQVDRGSGVYEVRLRAVDRVGNVGLPEETRVVLDADAPTAEVVVAPTEMAATVLDPGSGLRSLVVGARLLGDASFRVHDLEDALLRMPQGGTFQIPIPTVGRGDTLEYYLTAEDRLGNRFALGTPLAPARHVGANHPPTLEVEAPENGTEVKGEVQVTWRASDLDGDTVRVDVGTRPVVLSEGEALATRSAPRGAAAWDTRRTPDGVYVLSIEARDSESATRIERTIVVNNTGTGVGHIVAPGARVEYLRDVRFEVALYRPVVDARLVVRDDDRNVVGEHELHDDGARGDRQAGDGVYTTVYRADAKGRYSADLEVVYADAGTVVVQGASAYRVQSSFSETFERNLWLFVLGAVLSLALAAFVVVQLMRYGYI